MTLGDAVTIRSPIAAMRTGSQWRLACECAIAGATNASLRPVSAKPNSAASAALPSSLPAPPPGDIVPTSTSLRLAAPLEALFGFMLLTAAVSWVLQIYPALHRRRVLALQLSTLREARQSDPTLGIDSIPSDVLTALAVGVVEARNDFTQYGATYYFRDLEVDASLAASVVYATDLAAEATASSQPHTWMAGALITAAVNSLTELLDREFLRFGGDTASIVQAYAEDHRHIS